MSQFAIYAKNLEICNSWNGFLSADLIGSRTS